MNIYQTLPSKYAVYPRSVIYGTVAQRPTQQPIMIPTTSFSQTPLQLTQLQPQVQPQLPGPQIKVLDDNYGNTTTPNNNTSNGINTQVLVHQQPSSIHRKMFGTNWSWCSTVWSVISMVLCASGCGFVGLLCSVHAYVDHKTGDYMGARYKTRCACIWAIVGIILGGLGTLAVILIFVVFYDDMQSVLNDVGYSKPAWVDS